MPQIGLPAELTAAQVWAAATRALTDYASVWTQTTRTLSAFAAQDLFVFPAKDDIYVVATAAASASADTYGSWVQLSADIGAGRVCTHVIVHVPSGLTVGNVVNIQIGEGGSGNEAAVETINIPGTGTAIVVVPLHRALTDGARISVRAKNSLASAINYRVCLICVA